MGTPKPYIDKNLPRHVGPSEKHFSMDGLTEQNIVEMKSHFDGAEGGGGSTTGYLDADQIQKAISTLNKTHPNKYQEANEREVESFISYYTGSGGPRRAINFSEFLYLMAKRTTDQNENGSLRAAFNQFDINENEYVN